MSVSVPNKPTRCNMWTGELWRCWHMCLWTLESRASPLPLPGEMLSWDQDVVAGLFPMIYDHASAFLQGKSTEVVAILRKRCGEKHLNQFNLDTKRLSNAKLCKPRFLFYVNNSECSKMINQLMINSGTCLKRVNWEIWTLKRVRRLFLLLPV